MFKALLIFLTISCLHSTSHGQTVAELQAKIDELEAEVAILRSYVSTTRPTRNCDDAQTYGAENDGSYFITVNDTFVEVYCQFNYNGSGENWMVIQRRTDGSVDFYQDWANYTTGFGNVSEEFWLGLDNMAAITGSNSYTLRVELTDFDDKVYLADYSSFTVSNSTDTYKLDVSGYNGTAGDALSYHSGQPFSTYDQDNDNVDHVDCAESNKGGWWYNSCYRANLNGLYFSTIEANFSGIVWFEWGEAPYTRKETEMKIKPN